MRRQFLFIAFSFLLFAASAGILFSHHGLLDLMQFNKVIDAKIIELSELEKENRELKRRFDLFAKRSGSFFDDQIRSLMGWVRPGELVYFENER